MINSVVLISGVEQSDSVTSTYLSILFQILYLFRLLQSIEESSLCCIVVSCWLSILFRFIINFYCSILAFQFCVSFYCKAEWISYTYMYILLLLGFSSHLGHHGALSSLYYTISSPLLCIYTENWLCICDISNLSIPPIATFFLGINMSFSASVSSLLLCKYDHLYHFSRFNMCINV